MDRGPFWPKKQVVWLDEEKLTFSRCVDSVFFTFYIFAFLGKK
jgi:hypothetical protein